MSYVQNAKITGSKSAPNILQIHKRGNTNAPSTAETK